MHIEFDDVDVSREDALGRARAGISFVPQERNVFGALSVAENLSISAFLSPREESRRRDGIYARYPRLHGKRRALAGAALGCTGRAREPALRVPARLSCAGPCEALLTLANLLIVLGMRQGIREAQAAAASAQPEPAAGPGSLGAPA